MKRVVRIITIVVFVVTAIPISTCLRKGVDKNIEQYHEARKVNSEVDFAEALKSDGWIYADGAFVGKAPLSELTKGKKSVNLDLDMLLSKREDVDRIIQKIRGDYIWIELKTGKVERDDNNQYKLKVAYRATAQAEQVTFLGQRFETDKILPKIPKTTVMRYPEKGTTLHGYEVNGISSPYHTWLMVFVENGQIVESKLSLTHDRAMQDLKEAAEGDSSKLKNSTVAGFIVVWLILLLIVLWLEGKYIRDKRWNCYQQGDQLPSFEGKYIRGKRRDTKG